VELTVESNSPPESSLDKEEVIERLKGLRLKLLALRETVQD